MTEAEINIYPQLKLHNILKWRTCCKFLRLKAPKSRLAALRQLKLKHLQIDANDFTLPVPKVLGKGENGRMKRKFYSQKDNG